MSDQGKELEKGQSRFVAVYSVHHVEKGHDPEEDYESVREIHAQNLAEAEAKARELAHKLYYEDDHGCSSYTFVEVYYGRVPEAGQFRFVAVYSQHHFEKSDDSEGYYRYVHEVHARNLVEAEAKARALAPNLGYNDEMASVTYTFRDIYYGHVKQLPVGSGFYTSAEFRDKNPEEK